MDPQWGIKIHILHDSLYNGVLISLVVPKGTAIEYFQPVIRYKNWDTESVCYPVPQN